jgi:exodeoxyribonuclease VII large subunit
LQQAWSVQIDNFKRNQNHYQLQLEMLNPQRTLERGYAVILNPAIQAIRKPQDLNTQNQFEVRLAEGVAQVQFDKIQT